MGNTSALRVDENYRYILKNLCCLKDYSGYYFNLKLMTHSEKIKQKSQFNKQTLIFKNMLSGISINFQRKVGTKKSTFTPPPLRPRQVMSFSYYGWKMGYPLKIWNVQSSMHALVSVFFVQCKNFIHPVSNYSLCEIFLLQETSKTSYYYTRPCFLW